MGGTDADPFAIFIAPPPNETPADKAARERREAEEKRISDRIDEDIKLERVALKKKKSVVRVLLLGQSESGKSTTLKNFRMKYARTAWKQERTSWRSVIQLNLIRSVLTILETLQAEMDNAPLMPPAPAPSLSIVPVPRSSSSSSGHGHNNGHGPSKITAAPYMSDADSTITEGDVPPPIPLGEHHRVLQRRLGPLRRVEADLKRRLGAGTEEVVGVGGDVLAGAEAEPPRSREWGVRAWSQVISGANAQAGQQLHEDAAMDEATEVIAGCKDDMLALWTDEDVQRVLSRRRMRVEDSAGFFLNDLSRIARRSYEPTDDDIMRARLRTLGIQEYKIQFEPASSSFLGNVGIGADYAHEWLLYDVGGSRTTRHAWLPYFEAVNAIIFLAPVSCFDERLLEDSNVNRLEDSFLLWRAICASPLLAKTTMILFLNKCDILKRKLRSGMRVAEFLPSYGRRENDAGTVVKYLKDKFKDILKQQSPEPRVSYFYATSVTDTKATATTLKTVRDSILREHLKSADFIM